MPVSAQEVADRWEAGASAATSKFEEGVRDTDVDVVGKAIANQGALVRNFNEAVNSGRWARRLTESGGTQNWKTKTVAKAANYATGVTAAKGSFQAAMADLLPYIESGRQVIATMPKGTLQASKNRATAWIDHMHAYKRR